MNRFGWRKRAASLVYGALCHLAFLAAVGAMLAGLYSGMQTGLGPFEGLAAIVMNALLVLQFPVVHSFFLTRRGSSLLGRLAPAGLSRELATTTYVLFASLQILLVFALWSPVGPVLWEAEGGARWVFNLLYGVSWLLVVKTMGDAGLGTQLGFKGWLAVARDQQPEYGGFPTQGTFRYCRQPVYAAFALTLWTGPVWTLDHLVLAVIWTGYCVLGPRLKEARYLRRYGEAFRRYQERVPFMVPAWPQETQEAVEA